VSLSDEKALTAVWEVKRTVEDWVSGAIRGKMFVITAKIKNLNFSYLVLT